MAEYFSWTNISWQEKIDLTTLYGPYLALCKVSFFQFPTPVQPLLPFLGIPGELLWFGKSL
jgi:hypothetical protein